MVQQCVLRIETEAGLGPWCDAKGDWERGAGIAWCRGAASIHPHAHSYLEKKRKQNTQMRFGFLSFEQLFCYMNSYAVGSADWRKEMLAQFQIMRKADLSIWLFKLGYGGCLADETQCVFDYDNATRLRAINPTGPYITNLVKTFKPLIDELEYIA